MYARAGEIPQGSPPHTRGIRPFHLCRVQCPGITPAHAGNTQLFLFWYLVLRDHPRTRGEYSLIKVLSDMSMGSPPHTRGIRRRKKERTRRSGITPAHAGNTPETALTVHPREGSPPHTRGILFPHVVRSGYCGITPAHAGNTKESVLSNAGYRDHPRTRGEYTDRPLPPSIISGSPPHTRGIPVLYRSAGKSAEDHPRTRGEYPIFLMDFFLDRGSPPHTRGIPESGQGKA